MKMMPVDSDVSHLTSFDRAPWSTCLLEGSEFIYRYRNDCYHESFGSRDFLGASVYRVMSEVEGQGFFELLQQVYASGQPYSGDAPVVLDWDSNGKWSERHVDFTYAPVFDRKGLVTHIAVEGHLTKHKPKPVDELCKRIEQFGVGALNDRELLGLFCPDGGEDRAAALLQKFGSLKALLEASSNPLAHGQPDGGRRGGHAEILPKRVVTRLHLANELNSRVLIETLRERPCYPPVIRCTSTCAPTWQEWRASSFASSSSIAS